MFLGVDGGGTKTAICLVTETGDIAARVLAPSTDYFTEGVDLVARVLRDGVAAACTQADTTPDHIRHGYFGLATYGEVSGDISVLDAAPRQALGHDRYACGNDMVCGWAGSLGGVDGINVVSGTGSIAYGENHGHAARAGGWGELFGDEGSALLGRDPGAERVHAHGRRSHRPSDRSWRFCASTSTCVRTSTSSTSS